MNIGRSRMGLRLGGLALVAALAGGLNLGARAEPLPEITVYKSPT